MATQLQDLPDAIVMIIFSFVSDTRTRNSMALVCRKWRTLERSTRNSFSLRGNVRDLYLIPTCFSAVSHLDLSLVSPWGYSLLDLLDDTTTATSSSASSSTSISSSSSSSSSLLIAHRLSQAFPSLTSLTIYARTPSTLEVLAPRFPALRHVKLVRWHQRSHSPLGSDFLPLLQCCPFISSLDLSHFYCWTEDLPPALQAHPSAASSLTRLNLLTLSFPDGFKSHELIAISLACPNLRHLLAACVFDPRYVDFVGDDALRALAANCPLLTLLHLADTSSLSTARADPDDDSFTPEDARISRLTLEEVFAALPHLQDLTLDVCQNVRDAGPALETLNLKCPRLKSLALGQFHGICKANEWQLDGVALCAGLQSLSIKNSADLTDSGLLAISRGCQRLVKFAIQGCKNVTEMGMKMLSGMLRKTLVDISISCCRQLDAAASLRALDPIRDRIQRLHIDCIWRGLNQPSTTTATISRFCNFDVNELEKHEGGESTEFFCLQTSTSNKKCRHSTEGECSGSGSGSGSLSNSNGLWHGPWKRLHYLSLWISVGELLTPLPMAGLEDCPELEEIRIKVEGDCRRRPKPTNPEFGLSSLACYPRLRKMQLDLGDTIGYALTAPSGSMDLSLWDRFFLIGIETLSLAELDYWPPQDRDVDNRSLSLPAVALLAECAWLRKLFIHGTTHEHFMMFLLKIPNLRDVQLREDYYPAPENDMSTEMRMDSCSRFEDALNSREIED